MNEDIHLSVIIPAYNEAERIVPTLRATSEWLIKQNFVHEIVVVNDGSSDNTSEVVMAIAEELPNLRLVDSFPNKGKGHVVRVGMLEAKGGLRLFMDADNSTSIEQLPSLLSAITNDNHVVIGSRRANGAYGAVKAPWYRRIWSRIANRVVRKGLIGGISDTQCGFKLFTAESAQACFSRAKFNGWAFDLEVLALAQALGYKITELPVVWVHDQRTKINPIQDALKITKEFVKIRQAFKRGDYNI
jgi:dolichyl-phosphate beta-glucosyltransferase